jgi:hypothetical protein
MPRDQWVELQQKLVDEDQWIIDGDLGPYDAVEVRLRAVDTIILLISRLFAAPGVPCDDRASAPIPGCGYGAIAARVVRFSSKPSIRSHHKLTFICCATPRR